MPASRVVVVYGAADGIIRRVLTFDNEPQLERVQLAAGEVRRDMVQSLYAQCASHADIANKLGLNG